MIMDSSARKLCICVFILVLCLATYCQCGNKKKRAKREQGLRCPFPTDDRLIKSEAECAASASQMECYDDKDCGRKKRCCAEYLKAVDGSLKACGKRCKTQEKVECPPIQTVGGFGGICFNRCAGDFGTCTDFQRCCSDGCGQMCVPTYTP